MIYSGSIADIVGLRVGQSRDVDARTGVTVVLCENGAVASCDVRGGGPATRETDLLRPECSVERVNAIVLSGGSAFGLDSCGGVMNYLEERGKGVRVMDGVVVPIVCGASLFDLGVGSSTVRPTARMGYEACVNACRTVEQGVFGAGCGATVGKLFGKPASGGIGTASITVDGITVGAIVAVNAAGNVFDPHTLAPLAPKDARIDIQAEFSEAAKRFADSLANLNNQAVKPNAATDSSGMNTTLAVVATNATLTKAQAKRLAISAHDGFAMAIRPVHTPIDGDIAFALATCESTVPANLTILCAMSAEVTARAIANAVS